jgi:hypothetical protein
VVGNLSGQQSELKLIFGTKRSVFALPAEGKKRFSPSLMQVPVLLT